MNNNQKGGIKMDVMKLKLSSRLMRGIVAKMITRSIRKKYGYKVNIQLNDLDVNVIGGDAAIKVNAEVEIDNKEFMEIVKKIM